MPDIVGDGLLASACDCDSWVHRKIEAPNANPIDERKITLQAPLQALDECVTALLMTFT